MAHQPNGSQNLANKSSGILLHNLYIKIPPNKIIICRMETGNFWQSGIEAH